MYRTILGFVMAFALVAIGRTALATDGPPSSQVVDARMADRALGDPKAPVRMDEYFSLDCPHCARFDTDVLPKIKADYIDKGKVYLVFHDFPLHEISLRAHMIARCAPPERYLAIVETLFRVQTGWNLQTPGASLDALKQQARFAGMSEDQISACTNDRGLEDAILKVQFDATKAYGLNATPSFIFNQKADDKLVAEGPFETFKDKIDSFLAKKP